MDWLFKRAKNLLRRIRTGRASAHDEVKDIPATTPTPEPPPGPRSQNGSGMLTKITRKDLQKRFFRTGYRAARASGKRSGDEAFLKVLEAQAAAGAQAALRTVSEAKDKRRLARLEILDQLIEPQTVDRDRASLAYAMAKKNEADLSGRRALPSILPLLKHGAGICLTISIAPTLHDLLVGFDPFLKWIAAGAAGWGVAGFVVNGILPPPTVSMETLEPSIPIRNRGGFIGGLVLGLGVLAVRLVPARTFGDMLLAGGLTAFELSVVVVLEFQAAGLHAGMVDAFTHNLSVTRAERGTAAAKEEVDRRQALLDQTLAEIAGIDEGFEDDHELGDLKAMKEICVNAVRAGYERGISDNAGELGGVKGGTENEDDD